MSLFLELERLARSHPWTATIAAFTFYSVFSWLLFGRKLVLSPCRRLLNNKNHIKRLYIDDSTWYSRAIDVFRAFTQCGQLTLKAYENVRAFL